MNNIRTISAHLHFLPLCPFLSVMPKIPYKQGYKDLYPLGLLLCSPFIQKNASINPYFRQIDTDRLADFNLATTTQILLWFSNEALRKNVPFKHPEEVPLNWHVDGFTNVGTHEYVKGVHKLHDSEWGVELCFWQSSCPGIQYVHAFHCTH